MRKRFKFNLRSVYVIGVICFILWASLYLRNGLTTHKTNMNKNRQNKSVFSQFFIKTKGEQKSTQIGLSLLHTKRILTIDEDKYMDHLLQGEHFCNGNFIGYQNKYAKLLDVVVDPTKGAGKHGGENMSEVMNQSEESEYYKLRKGYFIQMCKSNVNYRFNPKSHVSDWLNVLKIQNETYSANETVATWTLAIQRYEYVNLYHTMTDFYNAFLLSKAFQMTPGDINIFWIDGHPAGSLDKTWEVLFGRILRSGSIRQPVHFRRLIWGIMGYDSPLNKHNTKYVPYLEEFREFFLTRHGIPMQNKSTAVSCDKIKVLFIWRRDYVAHPRNPSGSVSRKIKNEVELLSTANEVLPGHDVSGVQIDTLSMTDQLKLISTTDILIGMHGAGLSHTLFLPKHAGVIEFYPTYWPASNIHFKAMARWRNLHYLNWVNTDFGRELPQQYTSVDIDAFRSMLIDMKKKICAF